MEQIGQHMVQGTAVDASLKPLAAAALGDSDKAPQKIPLYIVSVPATDRKALKMWQSAQDCNPKLL